MIVGLGQTLPTIEKPDLPGYVTTEKCALQVAALQKKWDDHLPMMAIGGVAAVVIGYFVGKAM